MIKCVAIDDEPLALAQLEKYIGRISDLELVGAFYSAEDALPVIDAEGVELLFLDINMPDVNGMEFATRLKDRSAAKPVCVIFTTAYPQYAAGGFRLDAVDYLLKPLAFEDMKEAVGRAKRRLREFNVSKESDKEEAMFFKSGRSMRKAKPGDMLYIKGLSEYVKIILAGGEPPIVTLESMHRLEDQLRSRGFIRIHRSYIVNAARVEEWGKSQVVIGGETLPIGETYRKRVMEYLGILGN